MRQKPEIEEVKKVFVGRLLVPKLFHALKHEYDRVLDPFGLTKQQASILGSCDIGEARTAADLAKIYHLDASSIVRAVERLEKKGFLVRSRSKEDRRQVVLQITPKGRQRLWEAVPAAMEVARQAWRGVTDAEMDALRRIVAKVLSNLNEAPQASTQERKKERRSLVGC